jgi:cell division septum initiation protein DivIVA
VEAEIIRDLHLATSGLLSDKIGGPSVFPPLPSGVAALSYANNLKWNTSKNTDRYRRGMYTFFKRTSPHPNLTTFDCPDSNVTCVKRGRSNTPLAALATLNNTVFSEAAKAMAKRILQEKSDDADRIERCFRLCVARPPTPDEHAAFAGLLKSAREYYRSHEQEAKAYNGDAEASAWATIVRIILNMDEFITRE